MGLRRIKVKSKIKQLALNNPKSYMTVLKTFTELVKHDSDTVLILHKYGCNIASLRESLSSAEEILQKMASIAPFEGSDLNEQFTNDANEIFLTAQTIDGKEEYSTETFIYALHTCASVNKQSDTTAIFLMKKNGFKFDVFLQDYVAKAAGAQKVKDQVVLNPQTKKTAESSVLDEICINLNEEAKSGRIDPIIGREDEVLRTQEILGKRKKNNVVLIGDPGIGKTAIVEGIALNISQGNVPESLLKTTVYSLQVASMMAGTKYRGEFEAKLTSLLEEIEKRQEKGETCILFIDEIHGIVGSGATSGGGLDFANIIKPALSKGTLRCIGATTKEEWSRFFQDDKALKRRFSVIHVEEPTRAQSIEILKSAYKPYELKHQLTYSEDFAEKCVDLSIEFMPDQRLPDKAIDLLDLTGSIFHIKNYTQVGVTELEQAISRYKGLSIDVVKAKTKTLDQQEPMAPTIKKSLFGQDEAVDQVSKVVEKYLAGLKRPDKPIGSFLFVGPTGVGKTELAKLLAKEMKSGFERIDMSEYMEPHSISKLIGSPRGYVRSEEESKLSKMFEKNSRFVLLLDEIEKAHPKVLEVLLQLMDNAKITDAKDQVLDFKNVLLLMTSNAGAAELAETQIGIADSNVPRKINPKRVNETFTPEFRNRLNGIVYFNSLSKELMSNIVKKTFDNLVKTPLKEQGIEISISEDALTWIRDNSYDPNMGARPIERFIESKINDEVAQSILYGEIKAGKKIIEVQLKDDNLFFDFK